MYQSGHQRFLSRAASLNVGRLNKQFPVSRFIPFLWLLLGAMAGHADQALIDLTQAPGKRITPSTPAEVSVGYSGRGATVTVKPGKDEYPGVTLHPEGAVFDLSAFGHVEARVSNTGTDTLGICLRVDNDGDWSQSPWNAETLYPKPGETVTVRVRFGYSWGKPAYKLNPAKVARLLVFVAKPKTEQSFRIESIVAGDKVVIFSVWDPTKGDDPNAVKGEDRVEVLYEGEGMRIKRFGGEGTGGQCMGKYSWQIGATNRFLLGAQVQGQKTAYTAWIWTNGAWKKLATFRTRTGGKPLSGYYSFIEDFRRDKTSVHEVRRARFGNGWIKTTQGEWVPLDKARFTASSAEWESKDNINAGLENGVFFLATGGDTKKSRELRSMIELPAVPTGAPQVLGPLPEEVK